MAIKIFPAIRIASTNLPIKELLSQMTQAAQENPDVHAVVACYCGLDVNLCVKGDQSPDTPWLYGDSGTCLDLQEVKDAMWHRRNDVEIWASVHPEEEC